MQDWERREASRLAAIAILIHQMGGVAGAVWRLVWSSQGRFSAVQIRIALRYRWPLLVPNKYQVEDCLEALERQKVIACVIQKQSKIYERRARKSVARR